MINKQDIKKGGELCILTKRRKDEKKRMEN